MSDKEIEELREEINRLKAALARLNGKPGVQVLPNLVQLGQSSKVSGSLVVTGSLSVGGGRSGSWTWADFTATLSGSGGSAGTYAEDQAVARYCVIGNVCFIKVRKRVTDKGSWTGNVNMTLPVTPAGLSALGGYGFEAPPAWYAFSAAPNAPKAFANMYNNNSSLSFTDSLSSSFFTWAEVSVNDVLHLSLFYEV